MGLETKRFTRFTSIVLAIVPCASPCLAQPCEVTEFQKISSPTDPITTGYAKALAISGNTVIVGDETDDTMGNEAGAAFVYTFDGAHWILSQTLYASENFPLHHFGSCVAVDGEVAIIGTRPLNQGSTVYHGSAFVFTLIDGKWVESEELVDGSINDPPEIPGEQDVQRRFGACATIDGDTVLIGAPQDCTQAYGSGAVYHYQVEGGSLVFKQKLMASSAVMSDQFGYGIATDGTTAIIAAPGVGNGAAYLFEFDGERWIESQSIDLPAGTWPLGAIAPVDVHGDYAVLGSPLAVVADIPSGAAFLLKREEGSWQLLDQIGSEMAVEDGRFGTSVSLDGDFLAIGAPREEVYPPNQGDEAGAVYLLQLNAGQWESVARMVMDPEYGDSGGPTAELSRFGASSAMTDGRVIIGAPTPTNVDDDEPISAWYVFNLPAPDCDGNGVLDACDTDCNHNRLTDACELTADSAVDCNGNTIPDECDAALDYFIAETSWPSTHGALNSEFDFLWLNRFTVTSGHQTITHIVIPWTSSVPDGYPAKLLVYDDPNNDGHPGDAVLLSVQDVTCFDDYGWSLPPTYTIYRIDPTYVGNVGDSFFIGAFVSCQNDVLPAVVYLDNPTGQSWRAVSPLGQGNFINPSANQTLTNQHPVNYMLHALALDCNNNGAWDQCDIDSGFSEDANQDGIPDECQPLCAVADVTGNGVIDVDDLLAVINGWGACDLPPSKCLGDVTGDGVVDVDDLLAVVNNWGPCV